MSVDLEKLSRELTDKGKLIEAGWIGLRIAVISPDAPQVQIDEMHMAFFAGAQHLFTSIMSVLDPGAEPTEMDLQRMALIATELEQFGTQFALRNISTRGRA